ncbi:zinc metalloprotease [Candidatus Uabimicrobium sp. HlEnr_7]|uniref:zinc metalloprotease n=1 Tax=Candidatus Uabimicrobium helgolandensis TaxID=3095367 RepID=UPI003555C018
MSFRLLSVLMLVLSVSVFADGEAKRSCGMDQHLQHLSTMDSTVYARMEQSEKEAMRHQRFRSFMSLEQRQQVRTIPVVVHVVYRNESQNISQKQIDSQIRIINEDFRKKQGSKGHNNNPLGADTFIEFRLATVDPNGNATNGITRTRTNRSSFGADDAIKSSSRGGQDAWDSTRYLNLWVGNLSGGLLGYAQFPDTGSASTDGVVCLYSAFGDTGSVRAPFDLGRTTTHEIGHWLGLRHIWGDGSCSVDDGFSDTPRSDSPNFGKPSHPLLKCNNDNMFENYMDYTDDGAMNIFTMQQSDRMNGVLDTSRSDLLGWNAFGN